MLFFFSKREDKQIERLPGLAQRLFVCLCAVDSHWSVGWLAHSLAVQELHDGLQHIVGILGHAAAGAGWHIARPLHLAQDIAHLPHTLLNVGLETTAVEQSRAP